ncbi:hypothetical protein GCU60_06035 [Blastococcus saxobsidens]|uniref:Uncharacterized protein n=1 Tax=Blastococcus saxobsidens TaxID=138336 RepID=A0A6L9W0I8_9ACTN|nr:hypothetical protein [Blastococcus saxobsidens]NEK85322.1 hypothetical protein [Blastococcus saxobsidens]
MTAPVRTRHPLDRFWVVCLLLLVVVAVTGVLFSGRERPYWGQPRTEVTVTDVVYRDGPRGPDSGRCTGGTSAYEVVGTDGRAGTLHDCGTHYFDGDTIEVVWHEDEDLALDYVAGPGLTAAILGGLYLGMVAITSVVLVVQRRRERAAGAGVP